ncbi:bacterial capsule synthesis protein [Acinetobacter radioresistens SK82]|uniref:Bacterial capsule synthesis protein n=1 Tax=Acinetobacter radioresistens SK82 TaxID=596318 RepID=A0ABP2GIU7_ACIRA|nr:CapA family protein [Acinetobacter radioresistens]EET81504.1 bacterial capsule synthesis protein [Acinetobacter radioresistens SK82]QMU04003.1 CapA family protein [Acinetobacter radioresistens]
MKLIIAGDFCPYNRVQNLLEENKFEEIVSKEVVDLFFKMDYNIVNLECPVVESVNSNIDKVGPSIKTTSKAFNFLNYLNVNIVTLSNNHIMDYGAEGLVSSIKGCQDASIKYIGAGESLEQAREPLFISDLNQKVAIINITENEFSTTHDCSPGANPLDLVNNYYDIKSAKDKSDYVIVIYHGGHEGYKYPSPRMKKIFRYFIDVGADLVVCHHAHCHSGYEVYKNKNIYYGLGNFIFDWPSVYNKPWNCGYFIEIDTVINKIDIHPYSQSSESVTLTLLKEQEKLNFFDDLGLLNKVIQDDDKLNTEFSRFTSERLRSYLSALQPYPGYLLSGAYRRGILPNLLSKPKMLRQLNMIRCEAHRELYIESLKMQLDSRV